MLFPPLYLSFHLDSLHRHPNSKTFFVFPPRFAAFSKFPILAFTVTLLSLYSLRIYFRKIVALVQNEHCPFLLLHDSRHQITIYIIYDVISVITKNYLPHSASSKKSMICEVWASNSEWLKCYLRFMSKGGTTCPKLSFFFRNLYQFTKIFVTNFVPSWFWWIVDGGFNGIKHIFIQIFVQVDPHDDNTIRFYG